MKHLTIALVVSALAAAPAFAGGQSSGGGSCCRSPSIGTVSPNTSPNGGKPGIGGGAEKPTLPAKPKPK